MITNRIFLGMGSRFDKLGRILVQLRSKNLVHTNHSARTLYANPISPSLVDFTHDHLQSSISSLRVHSIRRNATKTQHQWPEEIKDFLMRENITNPTLVQEKTLDAACNQRDLVAIARTGSGKTLGFAIPAIMKILQKQKDLTKRRKPSVLVLEPTRELANQTADVFKKFSKLGVRSITLVGGSSRSAQVNALQDMDYDVYIATPGRLNDLRESNLVDLTAIEYLVLDEADRMLDMGFEPQVREILSVVPKERQTLMWSATWPEEIQDLAREFMKDFDHIAVDSLELKANPNITQIIEICEPHAKLQSLMKHLRELRQNEDKPRCLIFVNTKKRADYLITQLMRGGFKSVSLHGDKSQNQRDRALSLFKNKSCDIMVATDVAARGLDINDITHVINLDMPQCIEDYIHRIGRTARYEKKGTSISFLTQDDAPTMVKKLINVLHETNQQIPDDLLSLDRKRSRTTKQYSRYGSRYY